MAKIRSVNYISVEKTYDVEVIFPENGLHPLHPLCIQACNDDKQLVRVSFICEWQLGVKKKSKKKKKKTALVCNLHLCLELSEKMSFALVIYIGVRSPNDFPSFC